MKQLIKLFSVLFIVAIVFCFSLTNQGSATVKDLALENIEALAQSEGRVSYCMGYGSIDCVVIRVELRYYI